ILQPIYQMPTCTCFHRTHHCSYSPSAAVAERSPAQRSPAEAAASLNRLYRQCSGVKISAIPHSMLA
ncbi:MAG: hypothetical protein ABSE80_13055, partial [Halobacteriota archaeon]